MFADETTGIAHKVGTGITQPSLQEIKEEVWEELRSQRDFGLIINKIRSRVHACSFGNLFMSSGFRNRPSQDGGSNVEMDWAICEVDRDRLGCNTTPCGMYKCQEISAVTPGALVFSIGRTSGHQYGSVNGTKTRLLLRCKDGHYRKSDEYSVVQLGRTSNPDSEMYWIRNGIGVPGDSGAWILDQGTNNVIGQLWGRDCKKVGIDSNRSIITYFTPIRDIFEDIKDLTGATQVSLL
ncbi:hypothetical protein IFR05_017274 [Cadophora sp. M221]|nr:hypothetical protein IFR05_017274 [Cadophora sp. M221]